MRFIFLTLIVLFSFSSAPAWSWSQETAAKQALVMDMETGQVLFEKNSDQRMPTSSMSKVMTAYMVFTAIESGRIDLDTEFRVSKEASEKGGSKMFVADGTKVKVEYLLRGVIIQSGNDATIVLAEGLAGSEKEFAKRMTEKAEEIGMGDSNFMNASGWPDPNHYSTAHDLAIMARRVMKDFPEYYKMYGEKEFTYAEIKQRNRNPLLYRDIGADGIKTGHTEVGGYGLIGTALQDGRRVLIVLNGMESEKERSDESSRLITWGLDKFKNVELFKANQSVTEAPVAMGQEKTVSLVLQKNLKVTVPKKVDDKDNIVIEYKKPVVAPIKKGDVLGTLTIKGEDLEGQKYDLVAGSSVEKLGFFKGTFVKAKTYLLGSR